MGTLNIYTKFFYIADGLSCKDSGPNYSTPDVYIYKQEIIIYKIYRAFVQTHS